MKTLDQINNQLDLLIQTLQTSLARLLSKRGGEDLKTAIYLHCAMIVYYKNFKWMLNSRSENFIKSLNFTHLQEEEVCKAHFNQLDDQYRFTHPTHISSQELFFTLEFCSVVLSEVHKFREKLEQEKKNCNTRGWIFLVGSMLAMLIFKLIEAAFPTFLGLPWLMPFMVAVIVLLYLGAIISILQTASIKKNISTIEDRFSIFSKNNALSDLDKEIKRQKSHICPGANYSIPRIPKLLYSNLYKQEGSQDSWLVVTSLFFKLEKSLTIVQEDLPLVSSSRLTG